MIGRGILYVYSFNILLIEFCVVISVFSILIIKSCGNIDAV